MKAVFVDRTPDLRRVMEHRGLPHPPFVAVNDGDPSVADLVRLCRNADALLVEHTKIPAEVLDACPALRAIVFMGTGAGTYLDLDDAGRRGIRVLTTPNYGDRAVAEHAMALMLASARSVVRMDRGIRRGEWRPTGGLSLQGRKLAVIGMGGIGTALAEMASALGLAVSTWNRSRRDRPDFEPDLDEALRNAEIVSLHLALNAETVGLIDTRRLHLPRRGFLMVNTARAELIDEPALLDALASGQVGHAALDVFPVEPLPPGNPYVALETVTLTAHSAYMTDEAYAELWVRTLMALESLD